MKTKIILEMGCNHQGDIEIAKRMISDACKLGVWGVKFQKRDIDSISAEVANQKRDPQNSFGETYYEHRRALEFSIAKLFDLKQYAENRDLHFVCSAFDKKSLERLVGINCGYIKLPSQLYSNPEMLGEIATLRKTHLFKTFVSTGMHNAKEIFDSAWPLCADLIFHCISKYPCTIKEMNLAFIKCLYKISEQTTGFRVGYSSHELNGAGIKWAVMAGAEYVERHYTLSKAMKGSDHGTVSSDFAEMKKIISEIKFAEEILGDEKRECCQGELAVRKIYRGF